MISLPNINSISWIKALFSAFIWMIISASSSVHAHIDTDSSQLCLLKEVNSGEEMVKPHYQLKKVVIDAGHGGNDPGCIGSKVNEKTIALDLALKTGNIIQQMHPEVEVIYTRSTDVFIPLHERTAIANREHADLFISIHCNAVGNKKVYGTETFVLGLHRANDNLNVAKRENEAIYFEEDYEENYGGFDPNSPEGHILLSFFQNAFLNQSISLAEKIEKNFIKHNRHSRGVKQDGFLVLRHATMPAVLIEAGFLTNEAEQAYLMSEKGQKEISKSIAKAFSDYKRKSELYQPTFANQTMSPSASTADIKSHTPTVTASGDTIEFCIQILSSPEKTNAIDHTAWGKIKVRREGDYYKYQIAGFPDYETASRAKTEIMTAGYADAFLVAYHNNTKVTIQEAITLLESK